MSEKNSHKFNKDELRGAVWATMVIFCSMLATAGGMKFAKNVRQKQEKRIEQRVQQAIQEYDAQKAKTVNFTDSINQNTK